MALALTACTGLIDCAYPASRLVASVSTPPHEDFSSSSVVEVRRGIATREYFVMNASTRLTIMTYIASTEPVASSDAAIAVDMWSEVVDEYPKLVRKMRSRGAIDVVNNGIVTTTGWPMSCFECIETTGTVAGATEERYARIGGLTIALFGDVRIIAFKPRMRYLAVNVVFWATAGILLQACLQQMLRFGRRRRGQCVRCGYYLLSSQGRCSECGHSLAR